MFTCCAIRSRMAGRVSSIAFNDTRPCIAGCTSMFCLVSRDRANNSSFTGTSLTTTLYVGTLTWGLGSGTKLLVVIGGRVFSAAVVAGNWSALIWPFEGGMVGL